MTTTAIRTLDELGPALIGRHLGAAFRERILRAAERGPVVVDMAGIELVSPSFADELFAKLPAEVVAARRVRFANASDEIKDLARGVRGLRRRPATV